MCVYKYIRQKISVVIPCKQKKRMKSKENVEKIGEWCGKSNREKRMQIQSRR